MSSQRGVHNRIHNLRGEQFRHLQNLRGSRSHLTSINHHTIPSLPLRLLSLSDPPLYPTNYDQTSSPLQIKSRLGSEPQSDDVRESSTWRAEALSLVLGHLTLTGPRPIPSTTTTSPPTHKYNYATPRIPPLSFLCLQHCLSTCTTAELKDIVPYIPPHLQRDLVRFTAIRSPLSGTKLYTLWELYGHAHGEIIVVGPSGTLKDGHFLRGHINSTNTGTDTARNTNSISSGKPISRSEDSRPWDWDADDIDPPTPLTTLILLTTTLSFSVLSSLPPTLTHLALINISTPVSLHRLPNVCPLLVLLDVSYNTWLGTIFTSEASTSTGVLGEPQQPRDPVIKVVVGLERVYWNRWGHLKVLGFRGNYVSKDFVQRVNEGRWDDIEIVF